MDPRASAAFRHFVLLLASVTLGWLSTDVVPWVADRPTWGITVAGLIAAILAYVTPLVKAYGVGSDTPPRTSRHTDDYDY
jgi:hypothetical protein